MTASRLPRLVAIVGSGETSPGMAALHRRIIERFGDEPVHATLIDTPYGFQENAADITAAAVDYFGRRLRLTMGVASLRGSDASALARHAAVQQVRDANYVFCGPGSPSYALRVWTPTEVPAALSEKLVDGGALVMASAAALTLGRFTVPVYEVYKVGEEPRWLPGLDLLSPFGLPVAIVPHYDNAEGRAHDTRFCFLGERRLARLEADLPDDAFIIGVDEHTALILDLDADRATIHGRRGVTIRRHGRSADFAAPMDIPIDDLRRAARGNSAAIRSHPRRSRAAGAPPASAELDAIERAFDDALARGDAPAAVRAVVAALDTQAALATGAQQGPAGAVRVRQLLVRLAEAADGMGRRARLVEPLTDTLVELRRVARQDRDWAAADAIRNSLDALGVELHDSDAGTTWTLANAAGR
jgi:cyanophycinase-like exopeptidase